jgi:hypothetical protein
MNKNLEFIRSLLEKAQVPDFSPHDEGSPFGVDGSEEGKNPYLSIIEALEDGENLIDLYFRVWFDGADMEFWASFWNAVGHHYNKPGNNLTNDMPKDPINIHINLYL